MEAAWPSKIVVSYHFAMQCNNPEYHDMNLDHHENLRSHTRQTVLYYNDSLQTGEMDRWGLDRDDGSV